MLIKAKSLKGYTLKSLDGDIGSASEFLFDDRHWAVRYLVANTGGWLSGRKVLLSPYSLNNIDTSTEKLYVHLTKKQVEEIAKLKMPDLNAGSVQAAMRTIEGTARSAGITVTD